MKFIDFHVHIDYYDNPLEIAKKYEKEKIYTLFVTNLPEIYYKHKDKFDSFEYIRLGIGYHPEIIGEFDFNKSLFNEEVVNTKYIGEVGLDFSKTKQKNKKNQIDIFEYITRPKFNKGRVYSIHSKNAENQVLKILKQNRVENAVFHWYSGELNSIDRIVENGYYFSINLNMLKAKKGKKIIDRIPNNKIIFETDGPFTKIFNDVVKPNDIEDIYKKFENHFKNINFTELVFNNFRKLIFDRQFDEVE